MGTGRPGSGAGRTAGTGWTDAPEGHGGRPYVTPPGAPYVPPQRVVPPDGPYGPDPHGRKGPRDGRRARKIAGIVAASALALAAIVQIAAAVLTDGDRDEASGPRHTLALPRSLDDGRLALARDFSDEPGLALRSSSEADARGLIPVAGVYEGTSDGDGSPAGKERFTVRGYNGHMFQPRARMHDLLSTLEGDETSGGERERITPAGADEPLTCEVMVKEQREGKGGEDEDGGVAEVPVCAWAENGSVGAVLDGGPSGSGAGASESGASGPGESGPEESRTDLDAFAERVDSLRGEVSSPAARPEGQRMVTPR